MSRIHVLEESGVNTYRIVVHAPVPAGNNSAGVAWSTALSNSGIAGTQMTVGNGPGQISQAESNDVNGGTVIEATFSFTDDPNLSAAERNARLDFEATKLVAETQVELQRRLKYFGAVRA